MRFIFQHLNVFQDVQISRQDLSIIIAHALEYFDTALYAFLAPILAPIFFPEYDPVVQLILTYSTLASSAVTRPIGAFVFGLIARKLGAVVGLSYSLVGMAMASILMGLLPGFANMGWVAPLFLIIARMLRGFFAAGEGTIAKLYLFEGKSRDHALKVSHFYQSAAMLGMVFSSIAATLVITFSKQEILWRLCFCLGGFVGIMGYVLRRDILKDPIPDKIDHDQLQGISSIKILWKNRSNVLRVALATTFSYMTYVVPFVFINSFVPLVTNISLETMMAVNTALVILDMVMIPIIGRLLQPFEASHVMISAAIVLASTIIPLFDHLPGASIFYVTGVRVWVVLLGIIFLCPMNLWLKNLFVSTDQYLLVGIGTALGAGTLGRLTPVICFALWYKTEMPLFPALYLAIVVLLVAFAIKTARPVEKVSRLSHANGKLIHL